jgi:amino acid adenylation domain-containing protein
MDSVLASLLEVAERARLFPAVRDRRGTVSYEELFSRARDVATRLEECGAGPGCNVVVRVCSSAESVVSILGVLLAGATYVPVDLESPAGRLQYITEDSRAVAVLSGLDASVEVTSRGARDSSRNKKGSYRLKASEASGDLAYIIYTSGSTGEPKGVMVNHRNLAYSTGVRLEYYADVVKRFLLCSSLAFDSSIAGLFRTLLDGGELVLPDDKSRQDPIRHIELLSSHSITHFESVPSLYRVTLEALGTQKLPALESLVVAGESCPQDLVDAHYAKLPHVKLFNEYGPTEGTVWATVYLTVEGDSGAAASIGTAIPGTVVDLLDSGGHVVPRGEIGEICIQGPGVAQGYWRLEELSRKSFLMRRGVDGAVRPAYKTGDLGRERADGAIDFLGRADTQLSVRGNRVEPAEVEQAIRTQPNVVDASAFTLDDMLVAAVVVSEPQDQRFSHLMRSALRDLLSVRIIPDRFMIVDSLPVTVNGKVDTAALRELAREQDLVARDDTDGTDASPVAQVVEAVTGLKRIDETSNLFGAGMNSIQAALVAVRLNEIFGTDILLEDVLQAETLASITALVDPSLPTATVAATNGAA